MKDTLPGNIRKSIDQIRKDNASGSVELAKKSAKLLIHIVKKKGSMTQINNAAYSLVNAQPTMASIFNLVNNLMLNIDKNKNQKI